MRKRADLNDRGLFLTSQRSKMPRSHKTRPKPQGELLLQETASRLRQYVVVVWLEREPTFLTCANLLVTELRFVLGNESLLVTATIRSSIHEELGMACEQVSIFRVCTNED